MLEQAKGRTRKSKRYFDDVREETEAAFGRSWHLSVS